MVLLLKGYCASLCQGCTIIASAINMMLAIVVVAISCMVTASQYAGATHCHTIGVMMLAAGVCMLASSSMTMYGSCLERNWAVKMGLFVMILVVLLLIGTTGYASNIVGNIQTYAKDAWDQQTASAKATFEKTNRCCGFDSPTESPDCPFTIACNTVFTNAVKQAPKLATTGSIIGLIGQVACLLFALLVMSKLSSASKKQARRERRQQASGEDRASRVHTATRLGSRFGAAHQSEP